MSMKNRIEFFKEGIKHIKTTGTITRSSNFVCKKMLKHIDFKNARVIVELGAGDGVITKHILKKMHPDCKLIAFEVLDNFMPFLNELAEKDKRLIVAHDSAEKIGEYLDKIDAQKADYFVSALPFVVLPDDLGEKIVSEAAKHLKKGGLYIQLHYSLVAKKMYEKAFGNVDVNFVFLNVPPAFVLVSEKRA